jgi:hypothetical protein
MVVLAVKAMLQLATKHGIIPVNAAVCSVIVLSVFLDGKSSAADCGLPTA